MEEQPKMRIAVQYIATIIINLGAFTLGNIIGWSSPNGKFVEEDLKITPQNFGWIASIFNVGAAFSTPIQTLIMDKMGRKWSIIICAFLSLIGWGLYFLKYFEVYIAARFLLGLFTGGFCVVCPAFICELGHKSIRGILAVFFQFMITLGILFSYTMVFLGSVNWFTIACVPAPIALGLLTLFVTRESPVYYLMRDKVDNARKSLQYYRGPDYNIDAEIEELKNVTKKDESSLWESFKSRENRRAMTMMLGMAFAQQLTGINAVMFYANQIFDEAKSNIKPEISSIILGAVQVVATAVAVCIVDRLGRKILFYISLIILVLCNVVLAGYFTAARFYSDAGERFGMVPTIAVCVYILGFSLGTGPIPWCMIGELLPTRVKALGGSIIAICNWMTSFVVTATFPHLVGLVGTDSVFYAFAVFSIISLLFIIFFVIETKNKTLDEIQQELGQ